MAKRKKADAEKPDERVSLHPLEFEEAMKLLLDTPKAEADEQDSEAS